MSDNQLIQPGVRVDKSVWQEFRDDVAERRGGVRGHLKTEVENALRSYVEASKGGDITDRLRRIENQLDDIEEGVGGLSEESERKKNKDSGFSSTVENRLEKIEAKITREAGDAHRVHESIVNKAIEDVAGSSRPTLDRYREMLEQRHIAHEWPVGESRTWWLENEKFVNVLSSNFNKDLEFSEKYGKEWWDGVQSRLNDEHDNSSRGFE